MSWIKIYWDKIKSYLRSVDLFGVPIQMEFNLKKKFQTNFSALISLFMLVIFFGIFIYLYSDVHLKRNLKLSKFETRYSDPPEYNITTNEKFHKENLNNLGFFFYAIVFRDKTTGKIFNKDEVDQVLYVEALNDRRNKTSGKTDTLGIYEFLPCPEVFPETNLIERFQYELLGNALCLNSTINTIQGDFVSDFYRYMGFKIKSCKDSILQTKTKCLPDSTIQFEKARKNWIIDILYTTYNINPTLHDQSPLTYAIEKVSVEFSTFLYQKFDMYLSKSTVISKDNVYVEEMGKYEEMLVYINRIVKQESPVNRGTLFAFYLRSEYGAMKYVRTYKTILDMISQVGGLWKVIFVIGLIIIMPFNNKLLKLSISNRLYNIVPEDKKEEVAKTYTQFIKSSLIAEQNYIVKFENKTPLESRIAIDYYKYERNKGISFDVKGFFCFCCREKKINSTRRLLDISEQTLMKELNIRNVLKFAKKVNSLKKCLLKEKAVMLFPNNKNVVSTDSLHYINMQHEWYIKINEADAVSLSLFKEKFLLDGLRAMRNKVDGLDKKIDLDLLELIGINKNYLAKYFLRNIDVIKLKFDDINEAVVDMEDFEERVEEGITKKF